MGRLIIGGGRRETSWVEIKNFFFLTIIHLFLGSLSPPAYPCLLLVLTDVLTTQRMTTQPMLASLWGTLTLGGDTSGG